MSDSLEAMLEDNAVSGQPREMDGFKVSELIRELDTALNSANFYSKSNITNRNLKGMLRASAFQDYLQGKYGFRIDVLDKLIMNKFQQVLSVDGKGRQQIADMVSKGTMKIEAKSGLDIGDRLFGGQPR